MIRRAAGAAVAIGVLLTSGCQVRRQAAPIGAGVLHVQQVARVTDRAALSPIAWSPDGRRFAYGRRDGVWVHQIGDAVGTKITSGEVVTAVAWSPTADVIAYVDRGVLWTVRPDGRDRRRIPIQGVATTPVWAPGGDRLVVAVRQVGENGGLSRLWLTSSDGTLLRPIQWDARGERVTALGWFPDTLHLFVGLAAPDGEATVEWWQVRIAYPDFRKLPGPPQPVLESVLSSKGDWVAFVSADGGGERAYVVRIDGSGLHAISPSSRRIGGLAWSPHSDKVAYGLLPGEGQAEIYLTGTTGAARVFAASYRFESPDPAAGLSLVWAPNEVHLAYGTNTGTLGGPVWLATFQTR